MCVALPLAGMGSTPPRRPLRTPQSRGRATRALSLLAGVLGALSLSACEEPEHLHTKLAPPPATGTIVILPRQSLLPTFPCSRCHDDRAPNPAERRLVEFHTQKVLLHGSAKGWCYRCHSQDNIDKLKLQDGTLVSFDEAYELCGSCHGDKFRDFKAGIHGLTTGDWNGDRQRRSCPNCHDPHNPRFPAMTPERPPAQPRTAPMHAADVSEDSDGEGH